MTTDEPAELERLLAQWRERAGRPLPRPLVEHARRVAETLDRRLAAARMTSPVPERDDAEYGPLTVDDGIEIRQVFPPTGLDSAEVIAWAEQRNAAPEHGVPVLTPAGACRAFLQCVELTDQIDPPGPDVLFLTAPLVSGIARLVRLTRESEETFGGSNVPALGKAEYALERCVVALLAISLTENSYGDADHDAR